MQRLVLWTCISCIAAWLVYSHTPSQTRTYPLATVSASRTAVDAPALRYTRHARMRMEERGANDNEVQQTLLKGKEVPAKGGKQKFEKTFPCNCSRNGKFYETKTVEVVAKHENEEWVIITVIADYNP